MVRTALVKTWKRKSWSCSHFRRNVFCSVPGRLLFDTHEITCVLSGNLEWITEFGWVQYNRSKTQGFYLWTKSFAYGLLITRVSCIIGMFHVSPALLSNLRNLELGFHSIRGFQITNITKWGKKKKKREREKPRKSSLINVLIY